MFFFNYFDTYFILYIKYKFINFFKICLVLYKNLNIKLLFRGKNFKNNFIKDVYEPYNA